ncbi:hypothetical protein RRG08_035778 [Elysia crispata]|uniref:Uncharacterized protein n=1 Tax=Elysia crispata TaxID=231223 RepID=A0AAE0ZM16_9GAST|nr:hypothetical protein RRG08_035778 [Elysia crispata]
MSLGPHLESYRRLALGLGPHLESYRRLALALGPHLESDRRLALSLGPQLESYRRLAMGLGSYLEIIPSPALAAVIRALIADHRVLVDRGGRQNQSSGREWAWTRSRRSDTQQNTRVPRQHCTRSEPGLQRSGQTKEKQGHTANPTEISLTPDQGHIVSTSSPQNSILTASSAFEQVVCEGLALT